MSIARMALVNLKLALTVAVRFSATRRQFGPKEAEEEVPVLEYQSQVRLHRPGGEGGGVVAAAHFSHACLPAAAMASDTLPGGGLRP